MLREDRWSYTHVADSCQRAEAGDDVRMLPNTIASRKESWGMVEQEYIRGPQGPIT